MHHEIAQQSVTIDAPIAHVFSMTVNLEHFAAWFPGVVEVRALDDGPVDQPGKRYMELLRRPGGQPMQVVIQLVEAERPRQFCTEGDWPAVLPRMEMRFAPVDASRTQVHWRMCSRRRGLGIRLWLPLLRCVMRRRSRQAMRRLKALVEDAV